MLNQKNDLKRLIKSSNAFRKVKITGLFLQKCKNTWIIFPAYSKAPRLQPQVVHMI
jgi:hypothetical protein